MRLTSSLCSVHKSLPDLSGLKDGWSFHIIPILSCEWIDAKNKNRFKGERLAEQNKLNPSIDRNCRVF